MRRRIANIFAAVLGVMCIVFIIFAVRSFWLDEGVERLGFDRMGYNTGTRGVDSQAGAVGFWYATRWIEGQTSPMVSWKTNAWSSLQKDRWLARSEAQFGPQSGMLDWLWPSANHWGEGDRFGKWEIWQVIIPYWVPILLTGTWPVLRLAKRIRHNARDACRRRRGHCVNCGYHLRAREPGQRCPECGQVVAAARERLCWGKEDVRRRIAHLFAAVLGLMSLALVVLGVRSFWAYHHVRQHTNDGATWVVEDRVWSSFCGALNFSYKRDGPGDQGVTEAWVNQWRNFGSEPRWYFRPEAWFDPSAINWWTPVRPEIHHRRISRAGGIFEDWSVHIPYWIPIVLTGTWPVIRFTRARRRNARKTSRRQIGQCVNCGYDLRAHHQGEKCPECGRQIAATDGK